MISLICVALLGATLAADPLEDALQSNENMVTLFQQFKAQNGQQFSLSESPMRFRLFRKEVQAVVASNKENVEWKAGLNFFADLTEEERSQYLGLNVSLITPESEGEELPVLPMSLSSGLDWRSRGAVTAVKNQQTCGSCWTFAAVGSLEGVHKITTGSMVTFAEQELLDCVYEGRRDGCKGGWYSDAFKYITSKRRLAPSSAVRYQNRDGRCSYSRIANGLKGSVTGHASVPRSESGLMSALSGGPVAVSFQVTSQSQRYRSGIFRDTSCSTRQNHAVTAVGYSSSAIIVKNSWGTGWGERGYIRFRRGGSNCGLYGNNAIIKMSSRGQELEE